MKPVMVVVLTLLSSKYFDIWQQLIVLHVEKNELHINVEVAQKISVSMIYIVDHRQTLGKQLDEVEHKRNIFRQTLTEQTTNPQKHSLIQ